MMKVQGVIMDWAGTAVDYGCMAPVQADNQRKLHLANGAKRIAIHILNGIN